VTRVSRIPVPVRFWESGIFPGISGKQKASKMEPKLPVLSSKYIIKHQNAKISRPISIKWIIHYSFLKIS